MWEEIILQVAQGVLNAFVFQPANEMTVRIMQNALEGALRPLVPDFINLQAEVELVPEEGAVYVNLNLRPQARWQFRLTVNPEATENIP